MKIDKRQPSGREKNESAVKLLEQLKQKLYFEDVSTARRAAFKLSWMQEDGLDILKEALFSNSPRRVKTAAAYGLRSMHGRMKKKGLEVLKQGLEYRDRNTRQTCKTSLALFIAKTSGGTAYRDKGPAEKINISEIRKPGKGAGLKKMKGKGVYAGQNEAL